MNRQRTLILACFVVFGGLAGLAASRISEARAGMGSEPYLAYSLAEIEDFRLANVELADASHSLLSFVEDESLARLYREGLEHSRWVLERAPVEDLDRLMQTGFDPRLLSRDLHDLGNRLFALTSAHEEPPRTQRAVIGADDDDDMFPMADLSFCTSLSYGETVAARIVVETAQAIWALTDRICEQLVVVACVGSDLQLVCIVADVALAVYETVYDAFRTCAGAQTTEIIGTSYERIDFLKRQLDQNTDDVEKLESQGLEQHLSKGTMLASLYLPAMVGTEEIGGRLEEVMEVVQARHDSSVAAGINTHYAPFHIQRAQQRYDLGQWRKCYEDLVRAYSWMTFVEESK